jgi:hypothetical protein
MGVREFDSRQGAGNFFLLHRIQNDSGDNSASYPMVAGGGGTLSPGIKRPETETDHSLLSSAEVKNVWR